MGKLVGAWSSLAILFIIAAVLWFRPETAPGSFSAALWKIVVVIGL